MTKVFKFIGIGLFIYILSRVNWPELFEVFREMQGSYFALTLLFIFPTIFVRTVKWRDIIQTLEFRVFPFWGLLFMYLKGLSLGLITPGKLGEFYRARYLSERFGISPTKAFWTVFVEKGVDFLTDAIVAVFGIIILFFVFGVKISFLVIFMLLLFCILFLLLIMRKNFARRAFELAVKPFIPRRLGERAEEFWRDFLGEMWIINRSLLFRLALYDAFALTFVVAAHFFIALSLSVAISFWYLYVVIVLVGMLTVLPFSVLGIGVREVGYIFFFSLVGLPIEQALAFSLLSLSWSILFRLPGFIFLYVPIGKQTA